MTSTNVGTKVHIGVVSGNLRAVERVTLLRFLFSMHPY